MDDSSPCSSYNWIKLEFWPSAIHIKLTAVLLYTYRSKWHSLLLKLHAVYSRRLTVLAFITAFVHQHNSSLSLRASSYSLVLLTL